MRFYKFIKSFSLFILFLEISLYSQWISLNSGTSQNLNSIYFVDLQTGFACGVSGTIIKTTNGGSNWQALSSGTGAELRSIHMHNASTGLICGYTGTIIRTTDGGANWSTVISGTTNHLLGLSFYDGAIGICVGNTGTTLYTTNGGLNWLIGQPTGFLVTFYSAFMINASTGYCAGVNTIFSPLFAKTTNGGANWTYSAFYVNNNEATLRDIHFFDVMNGIAVSNIWNGQGGISRTTNGGGNWTHQIFTYAFYGVDFPNLLTGYIAGFNGNILKSTDGGNSWNQQTSPTIAFLKAVDFVDSVYGFATGDGGIILKTTNGGILGFSQINNEIPKDFYLFQNYPNPFNPVTKIKFAVPPSPKGEGLGVRVVVYDIPGREVRTLFNKQLSPGTYEIEFDGSNYPSGVYFYTLKSENFSQTRKILLIK